jgi:hypothetical protein
MQARGLIRLRFRRGSRARDELPAALMVGLLMLGAGARAETWALVGVRVIASPSEKVVEDGVVVVGGGFSRPSQRQMPGGRCISYPRESPRQKTCGVRTDR